MRGRNVPPWISLVSGGVAGGIEAAVTYPFEFSKTRLQLHSQGAATSSNPLKLINQVARNDGIRALYTGCSTLIVGTTAKAAIRFLSFDTIKNALADEKGKLSVRGGILAGMVAGAVESVFAVTPTERIKTALIDDAKGARRFKSSVHAARLLVQESGMSALYRGLLSTTLKQSSTSAVRMGTYNMLMETVKSYNITPSMPVTFGTGTVAGIVTVYATQPFDTLKTRAQSAHGAGLGEAAKSVIADHGIGGYWKGSSMRLGRLAFSGGIVFTIYEKVSALLSLATEK
ncbi:hypothetical protein EYZ11_006327 [Aspergillus tanneri]|uniref:Uncharacterized protein n=1 Tax=Aspergillus tanneri TaxID=1220188 RepID=A0A4S3JFN9_9EURO|nr:hypothetical protein EYZ11_006327 [Aspergillus tanneri]